MVPLFSDTTCSKDKGTSTWEAMYNLLEEEQPRPLVTKAVIDAQQSSNASYFETTCSFLHCIVARPKTIAYTNMVKWVIEEVYIIDRTFKNHRKEVMGSFSTDSLRLMYQLQEPQELYNKQLLEQFAKENEDLSNITQTWKSSEGKLK